MSTLTHEIAAKNLYESWQDETQKFLRNRDENLRQGYTKIPSNITDSELIRLWEEDALLWLGVANTLQELCPAAFLPYLGEADELFNNQALLITQGVDMLRNHDGNRNTFSQAELLLYSIQLYAFRLYYWNELITHNFTNAHFNLTDPVSHTPLNLPWSRASGKPPRRTNYHQWDRGYDESVPDSYGAQAGLSIIQEIDALLQNGVTPKILDIGMGTGYLGEKLFERYGREIEFIGVTVEEKTVISYPYTTHYGPAELLPIEWANTFDIVLSNMASQYMFRPDLFLSEAVRVTKKGGTAHLQIFPENKHIGNHYYWVNVITRNPELFALFEPFLGTTDLEAYIRDILVTNYEATYMDGFGNYLSITQIMQTAAQKTGATIEMLESTTSVSLVKTVESE